MAKWKSRKNTVDEEVGYSTVSTAAAWLSGLRHEFLATPSHYSQRIKYVLKLQ